MEDMPRTRCVLLITVRLAASSSEQKVGSMLGSEMATHVVCGETAARRDQK
jgi:hypothetical protein